MRSAADRLEVGWPEPAAVLARTESTRSCWASSKTWARSLSGPIGWVDPCSAVITASFPEEHSYRMPATPWAGRVLGRGLLFGRLPAVGSHPGF